MFPAAIQARTAAALTLNCSTICSTDRMTLSMRPILSYRREQVNMFLLSRVA